MTEHSPLAILLQAMRLKWEDDDVDGAVAVARLAAPYLHGRAATVRPTGDLAGVPDDELDDWAGSQGCGDGREAAAG